MEPWFAAAKPVASLEAEVCFILKDSFYYGPDKQPEVSERKLVVPLTLPDIPRQLPLLLRMFEAAGHEPKLAAYYEQIVRLAQQYQMPFDRIRHYFWLRFWLWNSAANVCVSFPWYDTFAEVDGLLYHLSAVTEGEVYYDVEQGWELEIHAQGETLFIREADPDANETRLLVSVPRAALVSQVEPLRERATAIIERLSELVGDDVWTSRVDSPTFSAKDVP